MLGVVSGVLPFICFGVLVQLFFYKDNRFQLFVRPGYKPDIEVAIILAFQGCGLAAGVAGCWFAKGWKKIFPTAAVFWNLGFVVFFLVGEGPGAPYFPHGF